MNNVSSFLINYMLFFLIALLGIIFYKMVTGSINTRNLLNDCTGKFSPGRLQLLISVLFTGFYYIDIVINTKPLTKLPPLPPEMLYIFGGSSFIYLSGKIHSTNLLKSIFKQ